MNVFLLNLLLTILWAATTGSARLGNVTVGFVVSFLVLWWLQPLLGPTAYFRKLPRALTFGLFFLWDLLRSNLRVAWDVVTPTAYRRPGIVAVPLDLKTDLEITLLANLLTLTPGSVTLDVSDDRKVLYVHAMFAADPEQVRRDIKQNYERRVMELFR
ncbi:MAG: hypothetical protein AMXMBFR13_33950 [Phycisphaerae bacterium]